METKILYYYERNLLLIALMYTVTVYNIIIIRLLLSSCACTHVHTYYVAHVIEYNLQDNSLTVDTQLVNLKALVM